LVFLPCPGSDLRCCISGVRRSGYSSLSPAHLDPQMMLAMVEDLSPDSTPRGASPNSQSLTSNDDRWADIAVDAVGVNEQQVQAMKQQSKGKDTLALEAFVDETDVSFSDAIVSKDINLESAGSRFHDSGRCKPCAFFHTKGCESAASCLFCHRCPAHEKQRRKRLRRQLCHNLIQGFDPRGCRPQTDARPTHPTKAGHSRMISSGTESTCSGWVSNAESQFEHSRTPSNSSQATGAYESGAGNLADLGYARAQADLAMYSNAQPQMMSWSEAGPNGDLHSLPVLEAQPLTCGGVGETFPGAGDVLNSMPPMPAFDVPGLTCKVPPPPPLGVPMVPGMSQSMPTMQEAQSPAHLSMQPASLSIPADGFTNGYEQQPLQHTQCPSVPVSPVGYMNSPCGTYQYALVPVPMQQQQQYSEYPISPTYQSALQAPPQRQPQHWGQMGAFEGQDYAQHGGCMAASYHAEQQWAAPYETMQHAAPYDGAAQWW